MIVRAAVADDHAMIATIVRAAFLAEFGRSDEPELVERMRALGDTVLENVAEDGGALVGHIVFSRAFIVAGETRHPALQLAPVCAAPGAQKRGVGSALIRDGLETLRARGETHVFLLGHPAYYPRFGFSTEAARAYDAPWNGPHHMLCRLGDGGPDRGSLVVSQAFA